ncbi:MAG: sigma-54-dependent Fis family transcriptional regulator, partial [Flavobacterium sp.]|nr:sigma-54-dependent Fis family transcriptional regulator [Flavobacterium sp.]
VNEALEILQTSRIDLLITDLQMPGINGIQLIKYANEHFPDVPKLVITGYPSIDSAVSSLKSGALEYLVKPFTSDELRTSIGNAIGNRKPVADKAANKAAESVQNYGGMVGCSSAFQNIIDVIERVKDNRATILISGESGTGKELVARAIHYKGAFAANPFIAVNCGAIPDNLLESELFGYVKGSFTGANETREGLFQAAEGGTIFLDEVGTAPLNVQTRLLRVLQEKEVMMIGSHSATKIQVRIIAATNSDLQAMIGKGTFREDLYYRLNVVNIETPPLRDRKEDIAPLSNLLLKKYSAEYDKPGMTISEEALQLMERHSWPGNVRELENVIQRMVIMGSESIGISDLPEYLKYHLPSSPENPQSLKEAEKQHIMKVLASVGNNKTKAAEILQIDRKTLRMKLIDS